MGMEGLPQLPEIIFLSGDKAYYMRDVPLTRRGVQYVKLYMILPKETRYRYGIKDEDLDYSISGYGAYKREYPIQYLHIITNNPENPMYLMLCGFLGTLILEPELAYLKNKMLAKDAIITDMQGELSLLRDKLREAGERMRLLEQERRIV